jgi:putative RNA 2'-phosphotransferase
MNESHLIERITRSLAFMLRHQPEQFDLELDKYGYADLDEVVRALNEKVGEPVEVGDVEEAVGSSGPRYEIDGDKIRALYGHSITVDPGDTSKPPEVLYVSLPEGDVERAQRFGLRGGRRRFLHLALTQEHAVESGRRLARDYTVLSIQALDAWEEGVNFYDRHSLWLAEEVPTHLLEIEETYHDGIEPLRHGRVGGRRSDRGGGRGDGGGREQGRGRGGPRGGGDRDRGGGERPQRDDEHAVSAGGGGGSRGRSGRAGGESRGRSERPRRSAEGGQDGRRARVGRDPERTSRDRDDREPRRERPVVAASESSGPSQSYGTKERSSVGRPSSAPAAPGTPFGAGLVGDRAKQDAPEPERKRARTEAPAPAPAPAHAPAPEPKEESTPDPGPPPSSFGAGL